MRCPSCKRQAYSQKWGTCTGCHYRYFEESKPSGNPQGGRGKRSFSTNAERQVTETVTQSQTVTANLTGSAMPKTKDPPPPCRFCGAPAAMRYGWIKGAMVIDLCKECAPLAKIVGLVEMITW